MKRLVRTIEPLPQSILLANSDKLRGVNFCFHDSFQLATRYPDLILVLGFIYTAGEVYPHAWIKTASEELDPTNLGNGPRVAIAEWSSQQCRDHIANSPKAPGRRGERAVIPPRINRAGDIVLTEIDSRDKERLNETDTTRAAELRKQILDLIASSLH